MTTANPAQPGSRLDTAIAAGDYEVVALRLALGLLAGLRHARIEAAGAREDLLVLMSELGGPR